MGRECGGAGAAEASLFQSPPRVEKKPTALLGAVDSAGLFKLSYLHKFNGRPFVDAANKVRLGAYDYGLLSGSVTFGRVTAGVSVTNVFNDRSIVAQSGLVTDPTTLYIFQARRSFLAPLKVRF